MDYKLGSSSAGISTTEMEDFEHYIPSSVEHEERRYHIFLSFRGPDTRDPFVSHLHKSLVAPGFNVFLDEERIEKGDNIGDSLEDAIRNSTVHIPILSPNYATSPWCLRELSLMCTCKSRCEGVRIIPLFYNVEPFEVRYQRGPYAEAFENYRQKGRHSEEEIGEWKKALEKVAGLSGWAYKESSNETSDGLVKRVVKDLLRTLNINYYSVAKHPVGIADRVQEVTKLLKLNDDSHRRVTVGIWGMGGLGKTTLCKGIYNSIHQMLEVTCFLFDIRATAAAKGLTELQQEILLKLEGLNRKWSNVEDGKIQMKNHLLSRRVLIILDDVDDEKQLDALLGDLYGRGSRIIITTRNKQLLSGQVDMTLYPMEGLDHDQSLKLFSWHAFRRDDPEKLYQDTAHKIVEACQGLPLSLEIIGAHLYGKKDLDVWSEVLARVQALKYDKLYESLKISYDALCYEEKQIFLDIACFFNDPFYSYRFPYTTKEFYTEFWKNSGYKTVCTSLQILEEKSLIKIEDDRCNRWGLGMHDHLRDLGRRIVDEESVDNPAKRSRLWCWDDITRAMTGTEKMRDIRGLMLTGTEKLGQIDSLALMPELNFLCFHRVKTTREIEMLPPNLKYLIFSHSCLQENRSLAEALSGNGYVRPSIVLPKAIGQLKSLCFIDMRGTVLKHLPDEVGELCNLKELHLPECGLQELPQSSGNLTKLEILDISGNELTSIPESFDGLKVSALPESLRRLYLGGCKELQKLPSMSHMSNLETVKLNYMSSLETLDLSGCKSHTGLNGLWYMNCLRRHTLDHCEVLAELDYLPESLVNLSIRHCYKLQKTYSFFERSPSYMRSLETLEISWCRSLTTILPPDSMDSLRDLSLHNCEELNNLIVSKCCNLQKIFICDMRKLEALCLS